MQPHPDMRRFELNGQARYDRTYRTPIIESVTGIAGKTFIDLGCGRGYESYSVAAHGAQAVLGVEGREAFLEVGRSGARYLGVEERVQFAAYDVRRIDEYGLPKADVVLHFGLLYHMDNPFNQLKHVRNICAGDLLLETQIAPLSFEGADRAQIAQLSDLSTVYLDGVAFEGRALDYVEDPAQAKGSLDRQRVFWLTVASVQKALDLAGFEVLLTVHNHIPAHLQPWGELLGYHQKRLKAFFHARVKDPSVTLPVEAGRIEGLESARFSFEAYQGLRRWRKRLGHWWRKRELS
jgi:SAM-dependent methyltransferase